MPPADDPAPAVSAGRLALFGLAACVGVIAVFWQVSRGAPPPSSRRTPTATLSPGPNLDFGRPPPGVPVFYYIDPRQPSWLVASDWTGKPRGTIKRSPDDGVFPLYASPDGSSVIVGPTIYGAGGRKFPAWQPGQGLPIWAADSRHMCGFGGQLSTPASLASPMAVQAWLPGEQPIPIGPVAGGGPGLEVAACSFQTNRVLLVERGPRPGVHRWTLVGMPGGALLHDQLLSGTMGSQYLDLVASPDARYVAQMVMQPGPQERSTVSATIQDAASGTALADLGQGVRVAKFSSDGEAVLTIGPGPRDYSVVAWRTRTVVWKLTPEVLADPTEILLTTVAKPRGVGFVLAFWRPQAGSCPGGAETCETADASPAQELLLVGSDGRQRVVAKHVALVNAGY